MKCRETGYEDREEDRPENLAHAEELEAEAAADRMITGAVLEHVRATGLLAVPGEHVVTIGHDVRWPCPQALADLENVAELVQAALMGAVEVDAPRAILKDGLLVRVLRKPRRAGDPCRHGLAPADCVTCEKYLDEHDDSPATEEEAS